MPRPRTTKGIARRVDFSYLKQRQPLLVARRWLVISAIVLTGIWFLAAGVRYDTARPQLVGSIHNPGPVSDAHAYFESDCTACHVGDGPRRFGRAVTDAACLTCHDGAIHHPNQKLGRLAIEDPLHPQKMRSASCVTCHVEHRGRPALAATSDAHCVVCHANLAPEAQKALSVPAAVTAFDPAHHPDFGRGIRKDGKWFDPTALKFNHAAHQRHVKPPEGLQHNCVLCHSAQEPPARLVSASENAPPYALTRDRPIDDANSSDRRYLGPVSYERHCAACHTISLPVTDASVQGGPSLPHDELAIVRGQLTDVRGAYRHWLNSLTPEQRAAVLVEKVKVKERRRETTTTKPIDEPRWLELQVNGLNASISHWFGGSDAENLPDYQRRKLMAAQPTTLPTVQAPDPLALEYYVAYEAEVSCRKCHDIADSTSAQTGDQQGIFASALATVPTGIPSSPRRWFDSAQFNHDAHRMMSCTDCHADALKSEQTSDVLLPGMTTHTASGRSCAECHLPRESHLRSAPGACVTCHLFHDRTLERPPDVATVRAAPPATAPAAAPAP